MDGHKQLARDELRKTILKLEGFKPTSIAIDQDLRLGPLRFAFPNNQFPLGAIHEFCCSSSENAAATSGFLAGLLNSMMRKSAVSLWISASRTLFPPALTSFGIEPDKIIFIDLQQEKDILWVMEEALKCENLAAVVGELRNISFKASRRLQLAVERSRVTGFIVRHQSRNLQSLACCTRWQITPLPSAIEDYIPGLGHPRWKVALLKVRHGRPGIFHIEWIPNRFRQIPAVAAIHSQRKTG